MPQQGGLTPATKLMAASALLVMLVALFAIVPTRAAILSQLWGLNQVYFAEFRRKLDDALVVPHRQLPPT